MAILPPRDPSRYAVWVETVAKQRVQPHYALELCAAVIHDILHMML